MQRVHGWRRSHYDISFARVAGICKSTFSFRRWHSLHETIGRFRLVEGPKPSLLTDIGIVAECFGPKSAQALMLGRICLHIKWEVIWKSWEEAPPRNDIINDASGMNIHFHMHPS